MNILPALMKVHGRCTYYLENYPIFEIIFSYFRSNADRKTIALTGHCYWLQWTCAVRLRDQAVRGRGGEDEGGTGHGAEEVRRPTAPRV